MLVSDKIFRRSEDQFARAARGPVSQVLLIGPLNMLPIGSLRLPLAGEATRDSLTHDEQRIYLLSVDLRSPLIMCAICSVQ